MSARSPAGRVAAGAEEAETGIDATALTRAAIVIDLAIAADRAARCGPAEPVLTEPGTTLDGLFACRSG